MTFKFTEELVGERIKLKLNSSREGLAEIMFSAVDKNRDHLRPWLPWTDKTLTVEDSKNYLRMVEKEFSLGKRADYGIYLNDVYVGNIGLEDIDEDNKSAEIGYWLSSEFTGNGYVIESVKLIEKEFFENIGLNRIQIKCDPENLASVGVAKHLNYVLEGTLRDVLFSSYHNSFRDSLLFSKLKSEYSSE